MHIVPEKSIAYENNGIAGRNSVGYHPSSGLQNRLAELLYSTVRNLYLTKPALHPKRNARNIQL